MPLPPLSPSIPRPNPATVAPARRDDRAERERRLQRLAAAMVCGAFGVDPEAIAASGRGPMHVAAARQVAIYLAHVALGLSVAATARTFGRDRATVAHACARTEDRRDDPAFDRALAMIEASAREAADAAGLLEVA